MLPLRKQKTILMNAKEGEIPKLSIFECVYKFLRVCLKFIQVENQEFRVLTKDSRRSLAS